MGEERSIHAGKGFPRTRGDRPFASFRFDCYANDLGFPRTRGDRPYSMVQLP